jgi:hypothetical protein
MPGAPIVRTIGAIASIAAALSDRSFAASAGTDPPASGNTY